MLKSSLKTLTRSVRAGSIGRYDKVHTVVMIRHGESLWNVENKYTGWADVPLTPNGEADAYDAGHLLGERGLKFDIAFTSTLERAWRTCDVVLDAANQANIPTIQTSRLNERHYGALQGHLKDSPELMEEFGHKKMYKWRRSFDSVPPSIYDADFHKKFGIRRYDTVANKLDTMQHTDFDKFDETQSRLRAGKLVRAAKTRGDWEKPCTESLKMCQERVVKYWNSAIVPEVKNGKRVLIVAHANTIRALVKTVDSIDDSDIAHLKIPNGVPLVYRLDDNMKPRRDLTDDLGFQAKYLVSARNHAKMMTYERCVRKKLRSLFEYLDVDRDGRITTACLMNGLARLQNVQRRSTTCSEFAPYGTVSSEEGFMSLAVQSHLFEVEELVRSIPNTDEHGGISMEAFMQAEEALLPRLTMLELLQ